MGLMERAVIGGERVGDMCGVSGGWCGGGGGMWSRHTFSLTRLEPTKMGVGSPRAKMDSVVAGSEEERARDLKGMWKHQGQTKKGQGKEGEGSEGVRRIER